MVTAALKLKDACSYDKPWQNIKKKKHYFSNKGTYSQICGFTSSHGKTDWESLDCESWTIKKAECQRIDAFEWWSWRRLLRVPWMAKSSNQSILKEISPEYSLEGLILKLKLQYFAHLMWRTHSFKKTLMLGKIEGGRRRVWQRMIWLMASPIQWTWVWVNSRSWWWTGRPGVLHSMESQRVRHDWVTELNWALKDWSFWTLLLEKTLESPLDCKEIQTSPS